MTKRQSLRHSLLELESRPPASWSETGTHSRPNLHGLLRYPAMMVPRMQGDIIDAILASTKRDSRVLDPFVGSGTVMTEALVRGLNFTGIDINPLAALVCEAKAAIDGGVDVEGAAQTLLDSLRRDICEEIDVDFPGRAKWFDEASARKFSLLRRSILSVEDVEARKVMWTVFAETVRQCSNSRTSTYKLHIRKPDDRVAADKVIAAFEANLRQALTRVRDYRALLSKRTATRPSVKILCEDARHANLDWQATEHQVLVTSPPYGDNQTTIPYGQFSYLAMRWMPECDLPGVSAKQLMTNTNSLDSASLGGTVRGAEDKETAVRAISPHFDKFMIEAETRGTQRAVRKVSSFVGDFYDALSHLRLSSCSTAHWVLTTGNRTAAGMTVPLDAICKDMAMHLGGKPIADLRRQLPNKRMPSRNSQGVMITAETTTVVEFA
jgi:adenine-specific DNA methylase